MEGQVQSQYLQIQDKDIPNKNLRKWLPDNETFHTCSETALQCLVSSGGRGANNFQESRQAWNTTGAEMSLEGT